MTPMLGYLVARLTEASTWAGLAALAAGIGVNLDPSLLKNIVMAGMGLAGVLAFFIPGGPAKSA